MVGGCRCGPASALPPVPPVPGQSRASTYPARLVARANRLRSSSVLSGRFPPRQARKVAQEAARSRTGASRAVRRRRDRTARRNAAPDHQARHERPAYHGAARGEGAPSPAPVPAVAMYIAGEPMARQEGRAGAAGARSPPSRRAGTHATGRPTTRVAIRRAVTFNSGAIRTSSSSLFRGWRRSALPGPHAAPCISGRRTERRSATTVSPVPRVRGRTVAARLWG
jgi:hypothetical protein